jgi:nicotinamide-nucleotide amidase
VHIGISGSGSADVSTITVGGDRHEVRSAAVRAAVDLLSSHLAAP